MNPDEPKHWRDRPDPTDDALPPDWLVPGFQVRPESAPAPSRMLLRVLVVVVGVVRLVAIILGLVWIILGLVWVIAQLGAAIWS